MLSQVCAGCGSRWHVSNLQQDEDEMREKALSHGDASRSALGLRVVRFRNDEVVRDVSAVVGKIRELIAK